MATWTSNILLAPGVSQGWTAWFNGFNGAGLYLFGLSVPSNGSKAGISPSEAVVQYYQQSSLENGTLLFDFAIEVDDASVGVMAGVSEF